MKRKSFKMYLKKGCEEEYAKRYNALWPDLKALFQEAGIIDFSIYFDKETNSLYAFQILEKNASEEYLKENIVMQKWEEYFSDIIQSNAKNQPIVLPLEEIFHIDWYNK